MEGVAERKVCYEGKAGAFQGYFQPNERKKACVNNDGIGHINMEVGNLNTQKGFDIKDSDCEKELHKVIDNCKNYLGQSFGGRFDNAGWTFR